METQEPQTCTAQWDVSAYTSSPFSYFIGTLWIQKVRPMACQCASADGWPMALRPSFLGFHLCFRQFLPRQNLFSEQLRHWILLCPQFPHGSNNCKLSCPCAVYCAISGVIKWLICQCSVQNFSPFA